MYCYTITRWPEIEWADDADDCDGADDIGPRSTPLTSLSERIRAQQQSETQVNHFIYSSLPLSLTYLSLPLPAVSKWWSPGWWSRKAGGAGIDGERITVKRID